MQVSISKHFGKRLCEASQCIIGIDYMEDLLRAYMHPSDRKLKAAQQKKNGTLIQEAAANASSLTSIQ